MRSVRPSLKDVQTEICGTVFDIQAFSLHDGPGIRTTIFLKGCPLTCPWCHNPESWSKAPQLSWDPSRCTGCGACVSACSRGVHRMEAGCHVFDRARCSACGQCAQACPTLAIELSGRIMTVSEVLAIVLADRAFHVTSGGGVTISGGEPLMQADFTCTLLATARDNGLHTAIDTSGAGRAEDIRRIARHADLVLHDLKSAPSDYKQLTGLDYAKVIRSLGIFQAEGCRIWLRLPLVPGVNDTPEHFENIATVVNEIHPDRVNLLPYHKLGKGKRERFGLPPEQSILHSGLTWKAEWAARLQALGVIVHDQETPTS